MRGYQLMTNEEIFRGRYLEVFDKPTPLGLGQCMSTSIRCTTWIHVFKAGHTVM